jgi:hypothetical protein
MLLGGLALAVSACFGCMFAALGNGGRANASLEGLAIFLAIIAFGGLCAALVGVVFVLMRIVRALFAKPDESSSVSGSNSGSSAGSDSGSAS